MFLDGENVVVEAQDVKDIEGAYTILPQLIDSDIIEFDLTDDSVIFDDAV